MCRRELDSFCSFTRGKLEHCLILPEPMRHREIELARYVLRSEVGDRARNPFAASLRVVCGPWASVGAYFGLSFFGVWIFRSTEAALTEAKGEDARL